MLAACCCVMTFPIIDPTGHGHIKGVLLHFPTARAAEAYDRISALEPDRHYRWGEAQVSGTTANVLFANQGHVLQSYTAAFRALHMPTNRGGVYAAMRADVGRARRTRVRSCNHAFFVGT